MPYDCQPYEELAATLKGTRWESVGGKLVLEEDFRFRRDHGFPRTGRWEVCRPVVLWLRADDDDADRTKSEALTASTSRLVTSAPDARGFNYLRAEE